MAEKIIGIDPGLDGAVCILEGGKVSNIWDIPTFEMTMSGYNRPDKKKRKVDVQGLFRLLAKQENVAFVILEQVWAMPKQGVSSAFTFGKTAGSIEACITLAMLPMHTVAPQVWKRELRVTNDKDDARRRAGDLFPEGYGFWERKKDHNRAEAALIAHYGALKYGVNGSISQSVEMNDEQL